MKAQAEFEEQLQNGFGYVGELQEIYRKNRRLIDKSEAIEKEITEAETDEEREAAFEKMDELEETEEYKVFQEKIEKLRESMEESTTEDFQVYDAFAELLVKVFDNQFSVDEVFEGLEMSGSLEETYSKIFANNKTGKPKKQPQTKQPKK